MAAYEARKAEIDGRVKPLEESIREIQKPYRKLAFEKKLATFPEEIQIAVHTPETESTPGQKLLAAQVLTIGGRGTVKKLLSAEHQAEIEKLEDRIEEIKKEMPEPLPVAMGIRDGDYRFSPNGPGDEVQPGKGDRELYDFEGSFLPDPGRPYLPPPTYFLPTADYRNKGPEVQPGFLEVITLENPAPEPPPSNGNITTGRRMALAKWLISEDHPLTARVMVNRIWQHHFGRGLVSTPSNFGVMRQAPTHPELLDWLATEFVRHGWSIKHMHRLIMTSQAYQMASAYDRVANAEVDPENSYLWRFRPRRVEGEVIRDIILTASGNLNLKIGGKPFFPPIPEKVRQSNTQGKWEMTQEGPAVWRRSIYSYWKRGLRYPMFDVFDLPDPNISCEGRTVTTVTTQALTLLNNSFVLGQARSFAERVLDQSNREQAAQAKTAFRIALSREPSPKELDRNLAFLRRQRSYHAEREGNSNPELEALTDFCHVVLNLNEFVYIN